MIILYTLQHAYSAHVIKIFSIKGRLIREYDNGILKGPSGVAVDKFGYCIVGDWYNRAV